jgi:DNA-binding transcriptional MocR family regulator
MNRRVSIPQLVTEGATPQYEQIADAFCQAIEIGQLRPNERLPTVRGLASELNVSLKTVAAAYKSLTQQGWTRGEIGRGTFVAERREEALDRRHNTATSRASRRPGRKSPWRRRALANLVHRLQSAYPNATNCSFGGPDEALLPLKLIKRHWRAASSSLTGRDLQYQTADPIEELTAILPARLDRDGIPVEAADLIIGTSAHQMIGVAAEVVSRLNNSGGAVFAVEQPGYSTIFDTWDRVSVRMIGFEMNEDGGSLESLESAIQAGANAVLFTPRAQNPTGCSWTPRHLRALGDLLDRYPGVVVIEDDYFGGVAEARAGSLLADSRLEERVVYLRSFSKAIAPDLRLCLAAARPPLKALLQEAKGDADGWSSRLLQKVLAGVLQDPELDPWLSQVRQTYRARRERAVDVLTTTTPPGVHVWPGRDGVNLWIHLPSGIDAAGVIERAASLGVIVAPGEIFYLSPGRHDAIRFSVGSVGADKATQCAEILVEAIRQSVGKPSTTIHV